MSALADHRIDRISTRKLHDHYPRTVGRNARLGSHGSGGTYTVAVVHTDQGASGWGIALGDVDPCQPLVGRRVEDVFDPAVGVTEPSAMPLDLALHDLAGRLLGQPVYAMLGAAGSTTVPCYDAAIYFDDLDPDDDPRGLDAVLANCAADHALGHRAFKLKIGRGNRWMPAADGVARDIEVTRAVRAAYPEARILVDANDGYPAERFVDYLEAVSDCGLYWIEEPFPETHEDLRRLRRDLDRLGSTALIADGEARPDIPLLLDLAAGGLLDVLLMDVVSYGFTAWRQVMPEVVAAGVAASPHAWGQPLKSLYAAHIAAGLGNVAVVEGVPGHTTGIEPASYQLVEGSIELSSAPGFGVELSPHEGAHE
ncbi:enolase C-terminal domain-like protein [Actinopolymorpha pittospori]